MREVVIVASRNGFGSAKCSCPNGPGGEQWDATGMPQGCTLYEVANALMEMGFGTDFDVVSWIPERIIRCGTADRAHYWAGAGKRDA